MKSSPLSLAALNVSLGNDNTKFDNTLADMSGSESKIATVGTARRNAGWSAHLSTEGTNFGATPPSYVYNLSSLIGYNKIVCLCVHAE